MEPTSFFYTHLQAIENFLICPMAIACFIGVGAVARRYKIESKCSETTKNFTDFFLIIC